LALRKCAFAGDRARAWLAASDRFAVDPMLPLAAGAQFHRKTRDGADFHPAIADTEPVASHHTEPRLARWLLRARDLTGNDTLNFTQEFLAEMLGVRRTSVTVVAQTLQQAGMIKYTRGRIQIIDIEGLHDTACECYSTVRSQYESLLGIPAK
jgi:CRP-like cAMP-binding protein